jgi:outer membrane receptor protein involved in Fe transport
MITFRPVSPGFSRAVNLDQARVIGIEGSAALRLPRGWSVEASGTLMETEDRTPGPSQGERLVYQPEELGWLGAQWAGRRVEVRYEITYVGGNSTDRLDTPALRLPSRSLHDALVSWRVTPGFRLGLEARNLYDVETRDLIRYPLPGRVILLHAGWEWGAAGT